MLARAGLLVTALAIIQSTCGCRPDEPPRAAPTMEETAPRARKPPPPRGQPHGALVVAAEEHAGNAAWALATDIYRDADLRPDIDDATARVLAGDGTGDGEHARIKDLAVRRLSIARAGSKPAALRLLASLGTDLGAVLVVAVYSRGGIAPMARVLRLGAANFEAVQLDATVERTPAGPIEIHWGAQETLRRLLPEAPQAR